MNYTIEQAREEFDSFKKVTHENFPHLNISSFYMDGYNTPKGDFAIVQISISHLDNGVTFNISNTGHWMQILNPEPEDMLRSLAGDTPPSETKGVAEDLDILRALLENLLLVVGLGYFV